jgi:aspartate 1-decarboxylase
MVVMLYHFPSMRRTFLLSKIHRAVITEANLNYEGSITIDQDLLDASKIRPFERVEVYNITNGNRFSTYAIIGKRGSGVICVNGAAAHLVRPNDLAIICAYTELEQAEIESHHPLVVLVDEKNHVKEIISHTGV